VQGAQKVAREKLNGYAIDLALLCRSEETGRDGQCEKARSDSE
jgi:hypothetical protein